MKVFVLNQQEWKEMKNDLSEVCLKKELMLNQTNLRILSSSFTSIGRMYFILNKCNSTLNTTVNLFDFICFIKYFNY